MKFLTYVCDVPDCDATDNNRTERGPSVAVNNRPESRGWVRIESTTLAGTYDPGADLCPRHNPMWRSAS